MLFVQEVSLSGRGEVFVANCVTVVRIFRALSIQPEIGDSQMVMYTETYARGGVDYQIQVQHGNRGLLGQWECPICKESGSSQRHCWDVEDAVTSAKTNLRPHHNRIHARKTAQLAVANSEH